MVTTTMPSPGTDLPYVLARQTKVLLVTDVVESVRLMEQDEDGFVRRWQHLVAQTEQQLLPLHGGRMVKSLGDGLMLEFADARSCIKAAFALQELSRQGNAGKPLEHQMHLRVGVHVAEFVSDKHDIYGTDVNLTARIAGLAGPREIVATADLRDRLTAGLDADIEDLGVCYIKHVKEPIRAYRVGPVGHAPVIPTSTAMRMDLRPTIAVIPFETQSSEPGQEMLGEALADEVIAALSRTSELHVISRLSTRVFRDRSNGVDSIREHLGASYILSGTCRVAGSQIKLFVELIDAKSKKIAWADNLRGKIEGMFSDDDELVNKLVASVSSSMLRVELDRAKHLAPPSLEGYTLLLGSVAMMHRTQFSDFDRAKQLLEHLVERSRLHPAPSAWLAYWHVIRVQQGWSESVDKESQLALGWARRALDNDPDSTLALTVDGFVQTNLFKDIDIGLKRYEAALDINPNESLAWLLHGMAKTFQGDAHAGLISAERALQLSPTDPLKYFYDSLTASVAVAAGEYGRAIELAKRSLRANKTHTSTYRALAIAQSLHGQLDEARSTVGNLLALEPSFSVARFLQRVPSRTNPLVQHYAEALRQAGLPE